MPQKVKLNGIVTRVFSCTPKQHEQISNCPFNVVSIEGECNAEDEIKANCPYSIYCDCISDKKITYEKNGEKDFGSEHETNAKFIQVRRHTNDAWGLWESD